WPVDFEFVAAPPQVVDVTLSPESTGGSYTSDQTVTVNAIVAPPEDDASVLIDSVIVNYSTASLGTQRLQMTNTGGDNYTVDLPALVDFEAPSLFVQAYGSNDLVGRFPISGAINFFVDGGAITSIETIQRTGDDLDGSSPVVDIQDLDYDITATVVSTASDGVISVQEGTGPWSGIFLALESSTVGLQRGDVVNITGGIVREASVANNSVTYTYLEDVIVNVQSSGADLTTVVPSLTTEEFNAVAAPGEAWEGMLVQFENVRITAELGFGEFEITSIDAVTGELLQESVAVNDDTRAGAIGETGFPNDFNLHARIGNDLTSLTGLITYTFGASKVIPRELEDIEGDNYTIPRPVFNLDSPAEGASVGVVDGTDIVAEWQSLNPRDYDFNTVTFEWVLYAADSTEIIALPSDNEGADAQVTIPGSAADGVLANLGVLEGESIEALWNVRAIDPTDTVAVAAFIDFDTLEPETIYRSITLTRGEVTSNEEFGGLPRTFDLEQNYPNPFNPTTQINYAVPEQSDVRIDVYNVIGRRVATLVDREMAPGNYTVNFNASQLSSGMYFYRLKAGSTLLTKKMTLIK
ncbi:MAG TPA: T9SS type A sorting domain-containing protein, partial [Balneolaceae bacterium]|nr:T9SS type A sorting domain-containing protein [Balneolaceae bacterium]